MTLDELKLIDLSYSQNLIKTPNFSGAPNLKKLIFRGSTRLSTIHASLGNLKKLIELDLNGCKSLKSLPNKIGLEGLEIFNLGGCSRLEKFPVIVGNMPHLSQLFLNETPIKDLPFTVEHVTGLIKLDLQDCKNLSNLPNAYCSLMSLKILILSGCSKIDELPENLENLKSLEGLYVNRTAIKELPPSISLLKNLKGLGLHGCEWISPNSLKLPLNIEGIGANCCTSLETISIRPEDKFVPALDLTNCVKLIENQDYSDLQSGLLRRYIIDDQRHDKREMEYGLVIPGSEIPKWLSHKNVGTIIHLTNFLVLIVEIQDIRMSLLVPCTPTDVKLPKLNFYYPRYLIEVKFETKGPGLEITKCGANWVFEQDIEDLKQTKAWPSSCSVTPYEDDLDTKIKQSRDEAGPSGEAPHPNCDESARLINLFFFSREFCLPQTGYYEVIGPCWRGKLLLEAPHSRAGSLDKEAPEIARVFLAPTLKVALVHSRIQ
nr:disease resistance-like protein csa1 [Quercus suber]